MCVWCGVRVVGWEKWRGKLEEDIAWPLLFRLVLAWPTISALVGLQLCTTIISSMTDCSDHLSNEYWVFYQKYIFLIEINQSIN